MQHLVQVRVAGRGGAGLNTALENFLRATREVRNIITAGQETAQEEEEELKERKAPPVSPLELMICAAEAGDEARVTEYSAMFTEHALKLVEVADLAVTMSSSQEGEAVEAVRQAAANLQSFHSQVEINPGFALISCLSLCLYDIRAPEINSFCAWKPPQTSL